MTNLSTILQSARERFDAFVDNLIANKDKRTPRESFRTFLDEEITRAVKEAFEAVGVDDKVKKFLE